MLSNECGLCVRDGGLIWVRTALWRVVAVEDAAFPGFCRVIWNAHVSEMTDLTAEHRALLMHVVWCVEAALREVLRPDKINVASIGNLTPHLHWHVIPRWRHDSHFPYPVWAEQQRPATVVVDDETRERLRQAIVARCAALESNA